MRYAIGIDPSARNQLLKLEKRTQERIGDAIDALSDNPRPPGCVKLTGIEAWRIRVGDYRIIYEIHDGRLVVLVVRIGNRKDVYR